MTTEKIVILDSSVWISYFIKEDIFHYEVKRKVNTILRQKYVIVVPVVVVYETINVILRKNYTLKDAGAVIKFFMKDCKCAEFELEDLLTHVLKLASRFKLKSQDLTILAYCDRIKPVMFLSNDVDLQKAYNLLLH